ncbi:MAG: penicillin-binding transpeptidase domain-containing protein, partial [Deltaproteobacteria bacterium]
MTENIRQREQDPGIVLRIRLLAWIGLGVFALLVVRLYWLQVVQHERFRNLAENNRLRIRPVRAPRGVILDRKGRPIAETQPSFDLICSPVDVSDLEGEIRLLAEVVEFEPDEVRDRILASKNDNPYSAVTVARDLKFEQVSVIEFNRETLHGFAIQVEAKRSYPYGPEFAHVLGYVGEANDQELGARRDEGLVMGDIVGKYGLEGQLDGIIRGINGGRYVEVDAAGRDKRLVTEVPPVSGTTVHTALDVDLQKAAVEAMADKAGAVIAMSPKTGDVYAFVSVPAFDPNSFSRGIRRGEWQALLADRLKPLSSKGLQGTYAPGSTVKPFLALAALETGMQEPSKTVSCGGSLTFGNKTFRCWKEKGHGPVEMHRAIVQSCDVYFYRLGLKLGPDPVATVERGAGLGTITGIDLPGER